MMDQYKETQLVGKNTGLPVLSGEYNRGFTKAITMLINEYDGICNAVKHHNKRMTEKMTKQWLECVFENRENLREAYFNDRYHGFIRWNSKTQKFEWYQPRRES